MIVKLQACLDCHQPAKPDGDRCEQCEAERAERERLKGPPLGYRQTRHLARKWDETIIRRGRDGK